MSKLNEFTQKLRLKPPEYEDLASCGPDHMKVFTQRVRLNGEVFPEGVGTTKKAAKHNAAKNAFEILIRQTEENTADTSAAKTGRQDVNHASGSTGEDELWRRTNELSLSKDDTSFTKKVDYVSIINKYCQTKKLHHKYTQVGKEGPSHNQQFSVRLELNDQQYPVAKAKTVKEAKQMAAQLGWSALQEQSDWDSKVSVGSAVVSQDEASEITSAKSSALLEPELSARSTQSSGSDWIQFEHSSKSPSVQDASSAQDSGLEKNHRNGLTATSELPRFNSDFDCIERLGNGSFGCVYKARHKVLGQYRAIKEIRFKDLDKSRREVKVQSDLDHPNIVRYYSCWLQDTGYNSMVKPNIKYLFIEMELCDGGTLRRWIRKKREYSENTVRGQSLKIARQILNGVEYIHTKKLIHRDLKPENILFGQDGNVRIGDFGLATQDNDDERTEGRGTRNYMAPEQVGVNYDCKVDIFALGLICFELFWRFSTGHERGTVWADVRRQKLPEGFTGTYPVESRIIKTMLSQKPEDRPEASALKNDLEKWTRTPEGNTDQENQTI